MLIMAGFDAADRQSCLVQLVYSALLILPLRLLSALMKSLASGGYALACSGEIDLPPPDSCSNVGAGPIVGAGAGLLRTTTSPFGEGYAAAWPSGGVGGVGALAGIVAAGGIGVVPGTVDIGGTRRTGVGAEGIGAVAGAGGTSDMVDCGGGGGGTSCAIRVPANRKAPTARVDNSGLRDFMVETPCQNTCVKLCGCPQSIGRDLHCRLPNSRSR